MACASRVLLFNAIGALLWAPLIAGIGYLFGHAIEWLLVDLKRYETIGLTSLLLFFVLVSALSHFVRDRKKRP